MMETIRVPVIPKAVRGSMVWIAKETNDRLLELSSKTNISAAGLCDYLLNLALDRVELIFPNGEEAKE